MEFDETKLKTQEEILSHHLFQIYQGLLFIQQIPPVNQEELNLKSFIFEWKTEHRKIAIFDLDETLVHCSDNSNAIGPDIRLPVTLPEGD